MFQLFAKQADLGVSLPSPFASYSAVDSRARITQDEHGNIGVIHSPALLNPWLGCMGLIGNPAHLSTTSPKAAAGWKVLHLS